MTIKQAKKLLGKLGKKLTNKQLEKEIEVAEFLSELILEAYPGLQIASGDRVK